MSYQVIARKWRPQTFEEVTGQEAITRTLRNAVEHERLHHAYLFSGARGVGKTTTARLLAKALNCHKTTKPNPTPCKPSDPDACVSCREIAEGRSIDVLEFDAASNTQVDKIRDLIIENINIAPARDRYKVFIIDEVHMLSTSSFNALLKTLEEPPPRVTFIMATTELHKVPDTILSRCQEFEFRTISIAKIFERLKLIAVSEKINITDEGLRDIARSGEGSMRDAQSNFDQVISFSGEQIETDDVISALGLASAEMLTRTIKGIAGADAKEILAVVENLIRRGQDLRNFCRDFLSFLRDLLIAKIAGDAEHLLESAALNQEELQNYGASFTEADLIRFFNSLSETETQLRLATQPRYILEIGLIKLIEMRRVTPIEKLLERLAKLEGALVSGNLPAEINPISETKPPVNSGLRDDPYSPAPLVEKKTPVIDFPVAEVPFPVGDNVKTTFSASIEVPKSNFEPPESSFEPTSNSFEPPPSFASLPPEEPPFSFAPPSGAFQALDMDFINAIPVKLPTISSEELEHIEDTWLDNAYEEKLRRSGDNLLFIPSASLLVTKTIGDSNLNTTPPSTPSPQLGNGASSAAAAPARAPAKPFYIPQAFESKEEEIIEQIELSENPTEEELLRYAENHADVRRVLKIFRGKIIKVTKDSQ